MGSAYLASVCQLSWGGVCQPLETSVLTVSPDVAVRAEACCPVDSVIATTTEPAARSENMSPNTSCHPTPC
ncbi:hypothetical protein ABBQ38_013631 [Trebouxia sp. C0009 RCD-2024]